MTPDLLLRTAKGRRRWRHGVFPGAEHPASQRKRDVSYQLPSMYTLGTGRSFLQRWIIPPQPTLVCPYLDLQAHKHSHKWYQRWLKPFGLARNVGWENPWEALHQHRCSKDVTEQTKLGRERGRGRDHWMLALTRHPVGIASQRVAGHCEGATVISLWTGLVMTGRPMGFWEMATVHDGPYSTHDMARASNTVLAAWTKLRLLEETGQSPSTVCFGRKMENGREGLPHLTSRQLPTAYKTMHTHTKFGQNIYIAHNPGH